MVARALAIAHTCIYEAWAAYDQRAVATARTLESLRAIRVTPRSPRLQRARPRTRREALLRPDERRLGRGCCAWDNKRAFNSIRPITAIRTVTLPAGSSRVEPGAVPATDLRLSWPTFSDAADQAGISRRYGGIYFEQGDLDARTTGRIAARLAWQKAQYYWQGS